MGVVFLFQGLKYLIELNFEPIPFDIDDYLGVLQDPGTETKQTLVVEKDYIRVIDINSDDVKHNIYNRKQLCSQIRDCIEEIIQMKRCKEARDGYFWNVWRQWIVLFRTDESKYFEQYLDQIFDNCDTYSTEKLIYIKKELYRFWRAV